MRGLQLSLNPPAEHLCDWLHVTMRLTVRGQYAHGWVPRDQKRGEESQEKLARLTWSLWHGNVYKALYKSEDSASLCSTFAETSPKCKPWVKAAEAFRSYL